MRQRARVLKTDTRAHAMSRLARRHGRRSLLAVVAISMAAALAGCSLLPPLGALGGDGQRTDGGPLGQQQPEWEPCNEGLLQCASVEAPLDWNDPEGEKITLSLVKREAEGDKLGALFINPGGPGLSGVDYYWSSHPGATGIAVKEHYDVIAWDPRGVGGSSAVECLDTAAMDDYLYGTASSGAQRGSDEWIAAEAAAQAAFGKSCAERTGDLLAHVDTASTVRDLEMLREISGDEKLNYLGNQYGTYIGALYADEYPDRVGRMVLDAGYDPTVTSAEIDFAQATGLERLLRSYVESCLAATDCPLSGTPDAAMQQVRAVFDRLEATPGQASDGRQVTSGSLFTALLMTLTNRMAWQVPGYIFEGPEQVNFDHVLEFADQANGRDAQGYWSNSTEAFTATNCLDLVTDPDPARMRERAAELEAAAPTLGSYMAYGDLMCAGWPYPGPAETPTVQGAGAAPILVLGSTDNAVYPYAWSESLAGQLDSGVLVTYEGDWDTLYGRSPCINLTVDDFFMEGTVPAQDPRCSDAVDDKLRQDGYDGTSRWPLELDR